MHKQQSFLQTRLFQHVLILFSIFCFQMLNADDSNKSSEVATAKIYAPYPKVQVTTNIGEIYLQLDGIRAPITVQNFLEYVEVGHYENTIFHRVIPGFMAQAGGYDENYNERKTRAPIVNESGNGLSNMTGTIAMARHNSPHTAASQFYINVVDNKKLDPKPSRWGYSVFGEVLYGMHLVQDIVRYKTGALGSFDKDVPLKPVVIRSMRIMQDSEEIPIEPIILDEEIRIVTPENATSKIVK